MTKIKRNALIRYNKIIAAILGILGISTSCDPIFVAEYGTPYAIFKINGTIENTLNSDNIENIRVIIGDEWHDADSVLTDATGSFALNYNGFGGEENIYLSIKDIDGAANGEFQDLDTIIQFNDPVFIDGDGSWYMGETSKTVSIKLKPKS